VNLKWNLLLFCLLSSPVEAQRYDGMIHGFFWMPGVLEQGNAAINQAANALKRAFYAVEAR
jgi:acetyl esterase/lipase